MRSIPSVICGNFGILFILCLLAPVVARATPPFARVGAINRVDAHRQVIVVDDVRYILPLSVQVYRYGPPEQGSDAQAKGRRLGSGAILHRGMIIGFNVQGEGPRRTGRIVEAWILHPGTRPRWTE